MKKVSQQASVPMVHPIEKNTRQSSSEYHRFQAGEEGNTHQDLPHLREKKPKMTATKHDVQYFNPAHWQWDEWIVYFETAAQLNNWGTTEMAHKLFLNLKGEDYTYIISAGPEVRQDYFAMKKKLEAKYNSRSAVAQKRKELRGVRQRSKENARQYGARLLRLVQQAHPEYTDETRREMAKQKFVETLKSDGDFKHIAIMVEANIPETLDDAVDIAARYEDAVYLTSNSTYTDRPERHAIRALQTDTDKKSNPSVSDDIIKKMQDEINRLKKQVEQMQLPPSQERRQNNTVTCYRCGMRNHYANECRSRGQQYDNRPRQQGGNVNGQSSTQKPSLNQ
jgi:hypothetical protein